MTKGNRTHDRSKTHATRAANYAARIAAAGKWLDEADPDTGINRTRRMVISERQSMVKAFVSIYATEYAALTGTHKRTAHRHLLAALRQGE